MKSINLVAAVLLTVGIIGGLLIVGNVESFYSGYFAGIASTVAAVMWLDED